MDRKNNYLRYIAKKNKRKTENQEVLYEDLDMLCKCSEEKNKTLLNYIIIERKMCTKYDFILICDIRDLQMFLHM